MARTINEIITQLKNDFVENSIIRQHYSLVPGQTFDQQFSKLSLEAAIFYVIALSIFVLETLFDDHKNWIEKRAKEIQLGNTHYYENTAKSFQFGYPLIFDQDEGVYRYSNEDLDSKIVKYCAAVDTSQGVLIKVAKEGSDGPQQLDIPEIEAFTSFMYKMKFAGVNLDIISREADLCKLYYKVYYDPLVLTSTGELINSSGVYPVNETIIEFISSLQFNGVLDISALTDRLQATDGVVNPVFVEGSAKFGSNSYSSIVDYYSSNAGYLKIDEEFPLTTTITYLPYSL